MCSYSIHTVYGVLCLITCKPELHRSSLKAMMYVNISIHCSPNDRPSVQPIYYLWQCNGYSKQTVLHMQILMEKAQPRTWMS